MASRRPEGHPLTTGSANRLTGLVPAAPPEPVTIVVVARMVVVRVAMAPPVVVSPAQGAHNAAAQNRDQGHQHGNTDKPTCNPHDVLLGGGVSATHPQRPRVVSVDPHAAVNV